MVSNVRGFTDLWPQIESFLEGLPGPICLLAHCGDEYDFRLFRDEMDRSRVGFAPRVASRLFSADTIEVLKRCDARRSSRLQTVATEQRPTLIERPPDGPTTSTPLRKDSFKSLCKWC